MKTIRPRSHRPTYALLVRASIAATVLLGACSNLTGLGGSDEYGCKAPAGVKCESVSGTYYNALQNNLASQRPRQPSGAAHLPTPGPAASPSRDRAPPAMAASAVADLAPGGEEGAANRANRSRPLRTEAKVLRLWIKAYEDSERDLHDQGFVFVQIESGRWLIDHAQRQAREAFAPIRPPRSLGDASRSGSNAGSPLSGAAPPSPAEFSFPAVHAVRSAPAAGVRGGSGEGQ